MTLKLISLVVTACVYTNGFLYACVDFKVPTNVTIISSTSTDVILDCERGFNLTRGDSKFFCVNDTWKGEIPACMPIECSPLSINDQANYNNYTGVTSYGTVIDFCCESGYHIGNELDQQTHVAVRCSANGQWETDNGEFSFKCDRNYGYFGCVMSSTLDSTLVQDVTSNNTGCLTVCISLGARYMSLVNSSCFCVNNLEKPIQKVNNSLCNARCSDSLGAGFCGGQNGEQSIYHVWDHCYDNVDINTSVVIKHVKGNMVETCKQFCLGYGAFYGILSIADSTCACAEFINTNVYPSNLMQDSCLDQNYTGTASLIFNTDDVIPEYTSCIHLYNAGVRLHGNYTLKYSEETTYCSFKDGTTCDEDWVGYNGACYLFNSHDMSFDQSTRYCLALNSTLVSILDESEKQFIQEYLTVYGSGDTYWFTGLYAMKNGVFMWTDGHLYQYTQFSLSELSIMDDKPQCVVLDERNNNWYTFDCNKTVKSICKKSVNLACVLPDDILFNANVSFVNDDMTLAYCIQVCKGQQKEYAAVTNNTCFCLNHPNEDKTDFDRCGTACNGNNGQMCGGENALSVINVSAYKGATLCQELELSAIGGAKFYLESNSSIQFCPQTSCPVSWVKGNASCYKFMTGQLAYNKMPEFCSAIDAYVACLENLAEVSLISNILKNIERYHDVALWMTGLYSFERTFTYRWFSSHKSTDLRSLDYMTPQQRNEVTYFGLKNDGSYEGHRNIRSEQSFICERNEDYLGCFNLTANGTVTHQLTVYDDTDIVLCIEWCRNKRQNYAMAGKSYPCACSEVLPKKISGELCQRICPIGQPCGGEGNVVSVYDIAQYPEYESCYDLFRAGISLSGNYSVQGKTQHCVFNDGETVCPEKWIGYNGRCYIGIIGPHLALSGLANKCRLLGGYLATIQDKNQFKVLSDYQQTSPWIGQNAVAGIGLVNQFLLGRGTWAAGEITTFFPYLSNVSLSKKYYYSSTYFLYKERFVSIDDLSSFQSWDFRTLCEMDTASNFIDQCMTRPTYKIGTEIDKDGEYYGEESGDLSFEANKNNIGCFNSSTLNSPPILLNWMELTLCKQLCIGNRNKYAGIGKNSCFCLNDTDLNGLHQLDPSYCNTPCPGNFLQYCGNGDTINVINIDETVCIAGWYGYMGICHKFILQQATYLQAAQDCIHNGAFLVSPTSSNLKFLNGIMTSFVFASSKNSWTDLVNQFGNEMYLTGDGKKSTYMSGTKESSGRFVYVSRNITVENTDVEAFALPYTCQTSQGYVGCLDNSTIKAILKGSSVTDAGMTATLCIQYCVGIDAEFAGIMSLTTCNCYSNLISITPSMTPCNSCPGYPSQACGNSKSISMFNLSFYSQDIFQSCDDLILYGISTPSWYYIKPQNATDIIKVLCFAAENSLMPLTVDADISASSSQLNHDASESRIAWPFDRNDSWKPVQNSTTEELLFKFSSEVVITGIVVQGNPLGINDEWTTLFTFKYWDDIESTFRTYSRNGNTEHFSGNTDRSSLKYGYLLNPIITTVVSINPLSWNKWPALRVQFLGQLSSLYNYSLSLVGCYQMNEDMRQNMQAVSASNLSGCKSACFSLGTPFFSIGSIGAVESATKCHCWSSLPSKYGMFNDPVCNSSDRQLVYKSYEKTCTVPNVIQNSNQSSTTSFPGAYTYRSVVTYTCDFGYIFPDKNLSKSVTCGQDNKWSSDIEDCNLVQCNELVLPANSSVDTHNVSFGINVKVSCDEGFTTRLYGKHQYVTCTINSLWNASLDQCGHYECDDPPDLLHATAIRHDSNTTLYICDWLYAFSNGSTSRTIKCLDNNHTWEIINDACRRQDDQVCYRATTSRVLKNTKRKISSFDAVISEFVPRSQTSCAAACLSDWICQGYNYKTDVVCQLFDTRSTTNDLLSDSNWIYFEKFTEELNSCS